MLVLEAILPPVHTRPNASDAAALIGSLMQLELGRSRMLKTSPSGFGSVPPLQILWSASGIISFALVMLAMYTTIPGSSYSIAAMFLFLLFVFSCYRFAPIAMIMLLPYFIQRASVFVSGVMTEHGAYLDEIYVEGYATGGFLRFAVYTMIFAASAAAVISLISGRCKTALTMFSSRRRPTTSAYGFAVFSLVASIVFVVYFVSVGLKVGFPIISGHDRSVFRHALNDDIYNSLLGNRPVLATMLGMTLVIFREPASAVARNVRLMTVAAFVAILIVSVLFSEKFTSIVINVSLFFSPLLVRQAVVSKISILKLAMLVLGLLILTLPVIIVVYGGLTDLDHASRRLASRMAASGQVWFMADQDVSEAIIYNPHTIRQEFEAMLDAKADDSSVSNRLGIHHVMLRYKPAELLRGYLDAHGERATYTFSFEAYLLMRFGFIGMILPLIFYGMTFGALLGYIAYGFCSASYVRVLLSSKILIFYMSGLASGSLWYLSGIKPLTIALILILAESFLYISSRERPLPTA